MTQEPRKPSRTTQSPKEDAKASPEGGQATNWGTLEVSREAFAASKGLPVPPGWREGAIDRLARALHLAAQTGSELPSETLMDCRNFLGVLVGR